MGNLFVPRATLAMAFGTIGHSVPVIAQTQNQYFIPSQAMPTALEQFARQSGAQIIFDRAKIAHLRSRTLRSRINARLALQTIVEGSGLRIRSPAASVFVVEPLSPLVSVLYQDTASAGAETQAKPSYATVVELDASELQPADAASQDIVVTATRRSESVQTVPLAVSAFSGDQLRAQNVNRIEDLLKVAPALQFVPGGSESNQNFTMRGVGNQFTGINAEQSVAVVIDDVVQGIQGTGVGELSDVERIEVLRGPQGTLFGKNASAGLIQIVTAAPDLTAVSGTAYASYASLDEIRIKGSVNVPLAATVAVRASAFLSRRDGYVTNAFRPDDPKLNADERYGGRLRLLWQPNETFQGQLIGSVSKINSTCCVSTLARLGGNGNDLDALAEQYAIPVGANNTVGLYDNTIFNNSRAVSLSGHFRWQFNGYSLTSVTAYQNYERKAIAGNDLRPEPIFQDRIPQKVRGEQWSQEFRLASPVGNLVDYVAGVFFYRKKTSFFEVPYGYLDLPRDFSPPDYFLTLGQTTSGFTNDNVAAFGQVNVNPTPDLRLSFGARGTYDDLKVTARSEVPDPALNLLDFDGQPPRASYREGTGSQSNFSWRASGQYEFSPLIMAYVSAARGYKAPVPRFVAGANASVDLTRPEIPTSYEVGLRTKLFDRHLTFNVTAFDSKFKDFQATTYDFTVSPTIVRVANAGSLKTRGIEVETVLRPLRGLSLSASGVYQDAKFGAFVGNSCYVGQTAAQGCLPVAGGSGNATDSSGNRLPNAPKWTGSFLASVERPFGNGLKAFATGNYVLRSGVNYRSNGNPFARYGGYGIFGGSVGVGGGDDGWRLSIFARNLFNKSFPGKFDEALFGGRGDLDQILDPEARRYIGAALDVRWGR